MGNCGSETKPWILRGKKGLATTWWNQTWTCSHPESLKVNFQHGQRLYIGCVLEWLHLEWSELKSFDVFSCFGLILSKTSQLRPRSRSGDEDIGDNNGSPGDCVGEISKMRAHQIPQNPMESGISKKKCHPAENDRNQLHLHNVVVQSQYFRSPFGPRKAFVDKFQIESKHKDRDKFRSLALHGLLPKFRKVSKFIPRAHDYFIWGARFIFPNQRLRGEQTPQE